jgi:hypothetical protein
MKTFLSWLLPLFALAALAAPRYVRYRGPHPLPHDGYCYIEAPHFHPYAPHDTRLYREIDGDYAFVGDPTPFGFDGPKYAYYGPHPMGDVTASTPVYCYLEGPHFHPYQPPTVDFEVRGGAAWYTGPVDPVFVRERPRYESINAVYRGVDYPRPVVDVTLAPPTARVVLGVDAPGGGFRVAGAILAPGLPVPPPPPGIRVEGVVGAPPPEHHGWFGGFGHKEEHDRGRHEGWEHEEHGGGRHEGWDREGHDRGGHEGWGHAHEERREERGHLEERGHAEHEHHDNGFHAGWGKNGKGH